MSVKLSLSLLPGSYEKHRERITGSHGNMEDPDFSRRIFEKFYSLYKNFNGSSIVEPALIELGPGGSIASGILARLVGFRRSMLIDVGDFTLKSMEHYSRLITSLPESEYGVNRNRPLPATFDQLINDFSISYKTKGLNDLKLIPSDSADFIFSNSVLEHIRSKEFREVCQELFRIQKPEAVGCHHVDYKDHLGGALNHLRFSSDLWEKEWIARAGFYTNRISFEEMLKIFEEAGFKVTIHHRSKWDILPIKRNKIAAEFQQNSFESLKTKGAMFILRK